MKSHFNVIFPTEKPIVPAGLELPIMQLYTVNSDTIPSVSELNGPKDFYGWHSRASGRVYLFTS